MNMDYIIKVREIDIPDIAVQINDLWDVIPTAFY